MNFRSIYHIIPFLLLGEFLWICLSGGGFSVLSNAPFFEIGVDPVYWIFYILGIPEFICSHRWLCISLDLLIFMLLIFKCRKIDSLGWVSACLFILLLLHYVTLTSVLGHRNFQSGYVWMLLPLLFHKELSRKWALECLRYYVLIFYVSSFLLKVRYGGFIHSSHFSEILAHQWTVYRQENSQDFRLTLVSFLMNHNYISYLIFCTGMLIELFPLIGFFTKRIDRFIFFALIIFHIGIWLLMDIAPIGQLGLLFVFLIAKQNDYPEKSFNFPKC